MKGEQIFNYSNNPFELRCFAIEMDTGIKEIPIKTWFMTIGIKPLLITISTSTQYNIMFEFKFWKFSISLNLRLWA